MADTATVEALLGWAQAQAPQLDALEAQILLAWVIGRTRAWLYAHARDPIDPAVATRFRELWLRRATGEPHAYLTGEREFYARSFRVTPAVLIPRPDTECLLEAALSLFPADARGRVVDAGTGSGALAVSFALERPQASVLAIERSAAAMTVAKENARLLGAKLDFLRSDWLGALAERSVDLLLSNPPYLSDDDPHLGDGGLAHEPRSALVAGAHGLEDIERLSQAARRVLKPGAWLLFEHGSSQGAGVREILGSTGFSEIETRPDLESRDRVTLGRLLPQREN